MVSISIRFCIIEDLARGDNVFFSATGITDGELVDGVKFSGGHATTQSLVMRSRTGTIRQISSRHTLAKIRQYLQPFGD